MNNPGSIQRIGTLFTRKAAHWNTRLRFLTLSTALKCSPGFYICSTTTPV
ncbi:hypothetical protein M2283_009442 [Streptomyces pseudovenezuelae]|uniref:Transposase n=1 Tax=Streptomyces pseudovenezuelae TaxID=67350 RepID=A0ABT6M0L1_9ACTN|nr:hypothetical protein [Streptomyces pseudovenezuelae]